MLQFPEDVFPLLHTRCGHFHSKLLQSVRNLIQDAYTRHGWGRGWPWLSEVQVVQQESKPKVPDNTPTRTARPGLKSVLVCSLHTIVSYIGILSYFRTVLLFTLKERQKWWVSDCGGCQRPENPPSDLAKDLHSDLNTCVMLLGSRLGLL